MTADLAPEERAFFGALREWRSARAREEGVPPYVLFTNRELVRIVKARPATPNALQALDRIGAGKVERYRFKHDPGSRYDSLGVRPARPVTSD